LEILRELDVALGNWQADATWIEKGRSEFELWNNILDQHQQPSGESATTYAQVIGLVNRTVGDRDLMITAAGGLPGEVVKGWRVKAPGTFDCEYGYSCMGYEIAGGWGAAMADKTRTPIVLVGDGSYLMMNSDIYSSVLSGHKMIIVVCDNQGFASINQLQNAKGSTSFNNLIKDCRVKDPFTVDFAVHAESMGALSRHCLDLSDLEEAMGWAQTTDRTTVISIATEAFSWAPGGASWDVGVPEVSEREEVRAARKDHEEIRSRQRIGV
jgi:3D-(3,5/4)-trihydroxycyclohexane-1,2-dione acylhydrolase (decyclizing)